MLKRQINKLLLDKSPIRVGVRIRKLFNLILKNFDDFADTVSSLNDSQVNTFFHNFCYLYFKNNKEMLDSFSKRGACGFGQLIVVYS